MDKIINPIDNHPNITHINATIHEEIDGMHDRETQQQESHTTADKRTFLQKSEHPKKSISAVEKQPISAEHSQGGWTF